MATNFAQAFAGPIAPSVPALPAPIQPPAVQGMDLADYSLGLASAAAQEPERQRPIDKLNPDGELFGRVRTKLNAMFTYSQNAMRAHYSRWNFMEQKVQAYVNVPDYQKAMQELNLVGAQAPEPIQVIVPYSYATLHAAATFLASVLLGRKPTFPLLGVRGTAADKARYMEQALQSNLEASRGYEVLWQLIWDSLNYGFGPTRIGWEERYGNTMRISGAQRQIMNQLQYAGNQLQAIDPYRFFPDPRVPIAECSRKGDFVFWVTQQSEMALKDMETNGVLRWVKEALDKRNMLSTAPGELPPVQESKRRVRIGTSGMWDPTPANVVGWREIREGTVRLIPKDWGLGEEKESALWKFSWFQNGPIVQCEPLGMIHNQHPVVAAEPTSFGHDFMSMSMADMISPFQDLISWLVNSRMENVRTTINNQFVADPSRVELQDIRTSAIGRIIRMKKAAMGLPIDQAIQQLVTQDVTMGHMQDIQILRMLADMITGVNDNMRGIQTAGGRRSATEARMSMQAGGSRLSQLAVRTSTQALLPLAEQMILNIQQFMPDEMWMEMTGDDGSSSSTLLTPDMLIGSFNYQISDGSLPYDKTALLEVWKEIMFGIAKDPELRQGYDLNRIFEYVAELGGAKNISAFKRQMMQPPPGMPQLGQPGPGQMPLGPAMPGVPAALGAL